MRKTVVQNGIIVTAYAGVTGVLLAFNFENDADRHRLLGFAIQRNDSEWLPAAIPFPGMNHKAGEDIPTNKAPVQKFRRSDYTTHPDTEYKYAVYAVRGTAPDGLVLGAGAEITITTESRDVSSVIGRPDRILTVSNRAVAASQAFSCEFPQTTKKLISALQLDRHRLSGIPVRIGEKNPVLLRISPCGVGRAFLSPGELQSASETVRRLRSSYEVLKPGWPLMTSLQLQGRTQTTGPAREILPPQITNRPIFNGVRREHQSRESSEFERVPAFLNRHPTCATNHNRITLQIGNTDDQQSRLNAVRTRNAN